MFFQIFLFSLDFWWQSFSFCFVVFVLQQVLGQELVCVVQGSFEVLGIMVCVLQVFVILFSFLYGGVLVMFMYCSYFLVCLLLCQFCQYQCCVLQDIGFFLFFLKVFLQMLQWLDSFGVEGGFLWVQFRMFVSQVLVGCRFSDV